MLNREKGMKFGVEVGVQNARYSRHMLSTWRSCRKYVLVDLWDQQQNYSDSANADYFTQTKIYETALSTVMPWRDKVEVCKDSSTRCALRYDDDFFDWVYLDARHDYYGVLEDIHSYWPKLRPGGLLTGHDYIDYETLTRLQPEYTWSVAADGRVDHDHRLAKGAVDEFARKMGRNVTLTDETYATWIIRK